MTNLVPIVVLLVGAFGLQWAEGKISAGGIQTWVTWIVGIMSLALALAAGTYAPASLVGSSIQWVGSFGQWAVLNLGLTGLIGIAVGVLTVLPQKWASDTASGMTLVLVFLIPTLIPYVSTAFNMFLAYAGPAASHLQGQVAG